MSITGIGGWEDVLTLANTFMEQLILEEKMRIVTGTTGPEFYLTLEIDQSDPASRENCAHSSA